MMPKQDGTRNKIMTPTYVDCEKTCTTGNQIKEFAAWLEATDKRVVTRGSDCATKVATALVDRGYFEPCDLEGVVLDGEKFDSLDSHRLDM